MTAIEKFLFDYDFDHPAVNDEHDEEDVLEGEAAEALEPEVIVPTFSEEEVNAAREEGFARGKEEGVKQTLESAEQTTAAALETILAKIDDIFSRQQEANETTARDAVNIATSITRKLFPQFSTRGALEEVERIILSIMEKVIDEPRLTITVNSTLLDSVSARLKPMMAETGFEGKVILNGEESLSLSDCRIEWGTGTASRDTELLWREIDSLVAENTTAEGAPAAPGAHEGETTQDADDQEPTVGPDSAADEKTTENRVQSEAESSESTPSTTDPLPSASDKED